MLNQQIMEVDTHRHLGINLSNDGSWHKHISYIKEKAWARINITEKIQICLRLQIPQNYIHHFY